MDLRALQRVEIRELCFFVAVAEELNFARAAERVGINISPLSRAITNMERSLGVRLFVRTRKGTRLTSIGEALLPVARQTLADAGQAIQILRAAATGRKGCLRVAFCENLALPRMAALMKQSREEDPDVELTFEQRPLPDQVERLRAGVIDIGLAASASDEPAGNEQEIDTVVLSRDPMVLAMPASHPLAAEPVIRSLEERMGPFILVGHSNDVGALLQLIPTSQPRSVFEFSPSLGLLLTRVASGDGIGLISTAQAEAIARPDIIFRPIELQRARVTTYLLKHRSDESALATRFIQRARRLHVQWRLHGKQDRGC